MGLGQPGKKQPQVGGDLGDRAHRGVEVKGRVLLVDGDGGGDALDGLDIGPLQGLDELAGIGGKGFQVLALAFLEDGVVGQGGLARTRNAADHDQLFFRQAQVQVLQVVLVGVDDL